MKIPRIVTAMASVVVLATVTPVGAHVAEVTTSVPLEEVQDSASLHRTIERVVDRARAETIAFKPSVVAVTGVRVLGERLLIGLLFADEDGEAMLQDLQGGGQGGEGGVDPGDLDPDHAAMRELRI